MTLTIALAGDAIITRRVSICRDEKFLSLMKVFAGADASIAHLEMLIHDYEGPEVYPAAEAGWTWMRSPDYTAEELKWVGFDMIASASNHNMDYSYGGLYSTWNALKRVGIPHAGTGRDLGEARSPAYLETPQGRVALISMCSSFLPWARAGEAGPHVKGRPGLNPLRYYHKVDGDTMATIKDLAIKLGLVVTSRDRELIITPSGLSNSIRRFVEWEEPGVSTAALEEDVEGNINAIMEAKKQADAVVVHLHTHDWDPQVGLRAPAPFIQPFARQCLDAGADVFFGEGSLSPIRGIEIYRGKPIFYDPGNLFRMHTSVTKQPQEAYKRPWLQNFMDLQNPTPQEYYRARGLYPKPDNPSGGQMSAPVIGVFVPVCAFGEDMKLKEVKIYPVTWLQKPKAYQGIPALADADTSKQIIRYLDSLSEPYGTRVGFEGGIGVIRVSE